MRHLVRAGYLDSDGGMLFIGPEAERRFGHRHFSELTAVFTAAPEFTVLHGRDEIGRTDPVLLTDPVEGPRLLLLAGRSWRVTHIDWKRRRCFVEPAEGGGRARWLTSADGGLSFELTRAMRDVLLGTDPPVPLTPRATERLATVRENHLDVVHPGGTMIVRTEDLTDVRWWTWAGERANRTLVASLGDLADPLQAPTASYLRLRSDLTPPEWRAATADLESRLCLPHVTDEALAGLKFNTALPRAWPKRHSPPASPTSPQPPPSCANPSASRPWKTDRSSECPLPQRARTQQRPGRQGRGVLDDSSGEQVAPLAVAEATCHEILLLHGELALSGGELGGQPDLTRLVGVAVGGEDLSQMVEPAGPEPGFLP
ncbi:hypothetical protein FMEAI12_6460002 [Parafrankia sp. Ea1.12]|nr:hypothetical protein FMEAI12_6460002 [Parafrankia sp. Ea1.12]